MVDPQIHLATVFASLALKSNNVIPERIGGGCRAVIKGARQSNFRKGAWPSYRQNETWSILPLIEWINSIYLSVCWECKIPL